MNARVAVLKQLVADSSYPVDEAAIAEAIVARSIARRLVPDLMSRFTAAPRPQVRSFRPHRGARSFRLTRAARRAPHRRGSVPARTRIAT
ncbi:MAG: hypothetical protein QOJ63_2094 [Solirubrobacteraceae bacterium]|nr:hypothetical protein [Solirubrobacteraceae bacterium]